MLHRVSHSPRSSILLAWFLLCLVVLPPMTLAGGGPENVLLVVNPNSASSLTIANQYAKLRAIPPGNVLYLPWPIDTQTTDVNVFRQRIMLPILTAIRNRNLREQIDYIIYSSDFPWGVDLGSDAKKFLGQAQWAENVRNGQQTRDGNQAKLEWPKQLTPVGSINGLTYLWQAVAGGFPTYFDLKCNFYMRQNSELVVPDSLGFRGSQDYGPTGRPVEPGHQGGRRYYLSMILGVTHPPGNSLKTVMEGLQRSAAADGTHPKGTIYFVKNKDIRSTVRDRFFPAAVEALKKLDVHAEILQGTLPLNKKDVQGVVMGTPAFDWNASGSTILPGALCDNFTSYGGRMSGAGQTLLTEFLRCGAAGASGTVYEPYAVLEKFPVPMVQVHYARGCTLAEAFYQSIQGPYQLLIVGDPLCRPWADVPQVSVDGLEPNATVRGSLKLTPKATLPKGGEVALFRWFVDGKLVGDYRPGQTVELDTAKMTDGYHELRVVAIGPMPIASQGRRIIPVRCDNHQRAIEASLASPGPFRIDTPIVIRARSPGSVGIIAVQGDRVVGGCNGDQGNIAVPPKTLGGGPVELRVIGLGDGDELTNVIAKPIELTIDWQSIAVPKPKPKP